MAETKIKKRLLSGHEVVAMSEEWLAEMQKDQVPFSHGVVKILPDGWLYPGTCPTFLDKIQNFKFRPDDVMVITFPKAGTTWMQEILWTMVHNPNLDNPQAGQALWNRSIDISMDMFFDCADIQKVNPESVYEGFKMLCPGKKEEDGIALQVLEVLPERRIIKSHFSLDLFPSDILEQIKVVYVARNPKDMVVSLYHFFKLVKIYDYKGTIEKFIKKVMNDDLLYCPYWPHIKQAWQKRSHPNLHFVFYEDMKADIMAELVKIQDFLGENLTPEQLENVAKHTSFSSMKSRGEPLPDKGVFNKDVHEKTGGFFRKGQTGDWKNHISDELSKEMDTWIKDNVGDSGIPVKWGN